jgi:nicotinamide-nucleotide amidase
MRELKNAEIIAVGSELLTPHRLDTNSLFLTGRLNELGIVVRAKTVVGDNRHDLAALVTSAMTRADVLLTTGGLGPTDDDLTREVIADLLGVRLVEDQDLVASIEARFRLRGVKMPTINRRQAMVPEGARVVPNHHGTAPGLILEREGRVVALLPGPPRELQPMFDVLAEEVLLPRTAGRKVRRRQVKVTGRSESQVEEVAHPIYSCLGDDTTSVQTTILASPGLIELHLEAVGTDVAAVDRLLDSGVSALAQALGDVVFSTDGRSLEKVTGDLLRARGWRVAAAESCTGGGFLARMTDVPGSSAWVSGGLVAYSNQVKVRDLDVPAALIDAQGAVSEGVAVAMAQGARRRFGTDVAVGITGIAGPDGGTPEKPVGTVVVAVATDAVTVRTFRFPGDREAIRRHSTSAALDMLRRALL